MPGPRRQKQSSYRDNDAASAASFLRVPPHNEEAELAVLGAALLEPHTVLDLCAVNHVSADSFWVPNNALLFETIQEIASSGGAVDAITVAEALRTKGSLDQIGGTERIAKIIDGTITAAHAPYYIDILQQNSMLRSIIAATTEAQQKCYDRNVDASLILGETEEALMTLSSKKKSQTKSWTDSVTATFKQIENSFTADPEGLSGISTGFANLNARMGGLRKSEMIVLAARPSMGKTSLAMNICEHVAMGTGVNRSHTKRPVGIFSCEMSTESLIKRMLCAHAKISQDSLNSRQSLQPNVMELLTKAVSELSSAQIYVDDTAGLDIMELRARARHMKQKYDIQLIMIDYLQLLNSRTYASQGRQLETSNISSNIKGMAKELDIPVIVLSQLSRNPEQRDKNATPKLSDLRDSGAIEQDADVVLLLRRPVKNNSGYKFPAQAIVDIAKNRNGGTGPVNLTFNDRLTTFYDCAANEYPEDPGKE